MGAIIAPGSINQLNFYVMFTLSIKNFYNVLWKEHKQFKELTPHDSHKSFWGKCYVRVLTDGTEVLFSYDTPIILKQGGELFRLWDGWSATTGRHIVAFCGLNKKGFNNLQRVQISWA